MHSRNTFQREAVLQAVRLLNHPTPDEVYNSIRRTYPNISRSTVYRNIAKLCDEGMLFNVKSLYGANHVDNTLCPHYHIVCVNCGAMVDADIAYMGNIQSRVIETCGYDICGYELVFYGLCPKCQNNERGMSNE